MAVIAITGDDAIALDQFGLQAHHNGFLADVEVTETTDLPHAIKLPGAFLEPADQHHLAVHFQQLTT